MSNAGKGKPGRIPGIRQNGGAHGPVVPPDLPYPCTIYSCSGSTEHTAECDTSCDSFEPTESQVGLQNIAREYARNGMSFVGVPEGIPVPVSGINVDLVELLCRALALEKVVFESVGISREEFDEIYREVKIEFLSNILDANKEVVRKARVADSLGIVQRPALLGPNGEPIG